MTKQQATNMTPLTAEELCFFKQYGYLLKSKAVAKSACELALDRMWATAPAGIKRDDPATWKPISEAEQSNDPLLIKQDTRWQLRAASTRRKSANWLTTAKSAPGLNNCSAENL